MTQTMKFFQDSWSESDYYVKLKEKNMVHKSVCLLVIISIPSHTIQESDYCRVSSVPPTQLRTLMLANTLISTYSLTLSIHPTLGLPLLHFTSVLYTSAILSSYQAISDLTYSYIYPILRSLSFSLKVIPYSMHSSYSTKYTICTLLVILLLSHGNSHSYLSYFNILYFSIHSSILI